MPDFLPTLAHLEQGALQLDQEINALVERCLDSLADANALRSGVDLLGQLPGPRAEFALCVFSLELARMGELQARENVTRHAGVLLEAHRSPDLARYLLANNPTLTDRWKRLEPLLQEFDRQRLTSSGDPSPLTGADPGESASSAVEPTVRDPQLASEEAVAQSAQPTSLPPKDDPVTAAVDRCWQVRAHADALMDAMGALVPRGDRRVEFSLCLFNLELARLGSSEARREFASRAALLLEAYHDGKVAQALVGTSTPLKALWTDLVPYLEEFFDLAAPVTPQEEELAIEEEVEAEEVEELEADDAVEVVEEIDVRSKPPPPPSNTPVPGRIPAYAGSTHRRPSAVIRPPPPPITGDFPSEETRVFWDYTEKALDLLPGDDGLLSGNRAFALQTKDERVKLNHIALEILERFPNAPPARALSCLIQLYLAAHMKEKTLFGKPNASRQEAMGAGLALLTGDPVAAGHAAALFETDGNETISAFSGVIDIVTGFLKFCMKNQLDPMAADAVNRYIAP